ncbi:MULTISPECIES: hypothetical protein [unclassified Roseofilum]|uniref:hypothetical protein n=1 Tax=unclassified Roseofilum TaxID=2620099 RepID=UPI001B260593|nr:MULTISPECIES: hypothetical protein [unclassified Roseofilum]MBP0007518.1 hypothetical protein [Roseofilum sp. Belize Diploria]MBP0031796.1 hypothetical protein [Roseofilum sp. Belize BBD 4]
MISNQYGNPKTLQIESEERLERVINELAQPQQGKLEPFAPVVINILRNLVQGKRLE